MYMVTEHVYALVGRSLAFSFRLFPLFILLVSISHLPDRKSHSFYCSNCSIVFAHMIIILLFKSEHVYHNKNGQNFAFDCSLSDN